MWIKEGDDLGRNVRGAWEALRMLRGRDILGGLNVGDRTSKCSVLELCCRGAVTLFDRGQEMIVFEFDGRCQSLLKEGFRLLPFANDREYFVLCFC